MTVIAYKDGVMVADSVTTRGNVMEPCMRPKIARTLDGRLGGAAGITSDCVRFLDWFEAGADLSNKPVFKGSGDDEIHILITSLDGSLWRGRSSLEFFEVKPPYAMGEDTASIFCGAAMLCGKSALDAMRLTIQYCVWVGGEPCVEVLGLRLAEAAD